MKKLLEFLRNLEKFWRGQNIVKKICTKILANFKDMKPEIEILKKVRNNFHES